MQKHGSHVYPLAAAAREVARHLRMYAHRYDTTTGRWAIEELSVWWQLVEETMVATSHLLHHDDSRRFDALDAVEWFFTDGGCQVLAALGLDIDYVQMIVRRWLHHSGLRAT